MGNRLVSLSFDDTNKKNESCHAGDFQHSTTAWHIILKQKFDTPPRFKLRDSSVVINSEILG
jgi:hypothetical protein